MTSLADIIDECEHGSTAAFCPVCKDDIKAGLRRRRERANAAAWGTDETLPFPSTTAEYRSLCRGCDEWIIEDQTIYRVTLGGKRWWVCEGCAREEATLRSTDA